MLIRFKSPAHHEVLMFGQVAEQLLALMGMSGRVPGALTGDDVTAARERLLAGLANLPAPPAPAEESQEENGEAREPPVPLRTRAVPLLQLLEAAARRESHVMWEALK